MSSAARRAGWAAALVAVVVLVALGARTTPTEGMSDDRLYALAGQMKCLQCAGESVAGSESDIAQRMREEIRRQMRRGRSDDEILTFFADRYGQRVLLNPSSDGIAALVWVVPVVVVALGAVGVGFRFASARRQRADAAVEAVSPEDEAMVAAALADLRPETDGR